MGSRVELFEKIRRDREFADLSLHALARRYGVHRRTVRQALESSLPPERKRPEGRPAPALGPFPELQTFRCRRCGHVETVEAPQRSAS